MENAYICRPISDDKEYHGGKKITPKWKEATYTEYWEKVENEEDMLGSQNEIQYAADIDELRERLTLMAGAPIGFDIYVQGCYYPSRKLYRLRHPLVGELCEVQDICDEVRERKKLFIDRIRATKLFKDSGIVPNVRSVNPIDDESLLKPSPSANGYCLIQHNPRQAKGMRTRRANQGVAGAKEERMKKLTVRRHQEYEARDEIRVGYAESRRTMLDAVYNTLLSPLITAVCPGNQSVKISDMAYEYRYTYSKPSDKKVMDRLEEMLKFYDSLGIDPAEFFDPSSDRYVEMEEKDDRKNVERFIETFEREFECYAKPMRRLMVFSKDSVLFNVEKAHTRKLMSAHQWAMLSSRKRNYKRLKKLVDAIRVLREITEVAGVGDDPILGPPRPLDSVVKEEDEYISSGAFLNEPELREHEKEKVA
jgi:hypothetical protein